MVSKEIGSEIVFGIVMIQAEKLNHCRRALGSQWNPEGASILCKDQPCSGFGMK